MIIPFQAPQLRLILNFFLKFPFLFLKSSINNGSISTLYKQIKMDNKFEALHNTINLGLLDIYVNKILTSINSSNLMFLPVMHSVCFIRQKKISTARANITNFFNFSYDHFGRWWVKFRCSLSFTTHIEFHRSWWVQGGRNIVNLYMTQFVCLQSFFTGEGTKT